MASPRPPLAVQLLVLLTLTLGMGALFLLGRHSEVPPLMPFLAWTALLVLTEATAIELPRGGYISVSGVVDYAGLLCFGGAIEIAQSFTPTRNAEWGDLLADAVGMAAGVFAAMLVTRVVLGRTQAL